MFTGRTGDDMRMACCHLIESLATKASGLYLESDTGREDAEQALEFLERILGCGEEHMYAAASSAYASICEHVIANDVSWHIKVTKRILNGISEGSFFEKQRGFSLAAGACGDSSMSGEVLAVLSQEITKNVDVEVRRNSATSLAALPKRVLREQVDDVLQSLVSGMADYATDDRGDVGSWVREASMISACKVIGIVFGEDLQNDKLPLDTASTKKLLMCVLHGIMRQCCSRIDRTRGVAGAALKSFCEFFTADCRDISLEMLCRDISYCFGFISNDQSSADTVSPEVIFIKSESVFPALEMALGISEISDAVLLGLVWAVGGTGHQSKMARKAVVQYFGSIKEESMKMAELQKVVQVIVDRDELLTIPAMQVIECLAKGGVFDNVDSRKLKDVAWIVRGSWRQRLRDVKRTCTAVHVLCELASLSSCDESFDFQGGSLGCECLEALAIVLGGPIPRLRRITADGIYMVLLEFDIDGFDSEDNCESSKIIEKVQASLKILSETRWEILSLSAAREQRNQLCRILEIRAPVIQSK